MTTSVDRNDSPRWFRPALSALIALSFTIALWATGSPTGSLDPDLFDGPSNLYSSWIFADDRLAMYSRPIAEYLEPPSAEQVAQLTSEGFSEGAISNYPSPRGDEAVFIVWDQYPRLYPPGAFVAWLPFSLLHRDGSLPLLAAILGMAFFWLWAGVYATMLLAGHARSSASALGKWGMALAATIGVIWGFELITWSLLSQFDALAVLPLVAAIIALDRRRPEWALVLYAVSVSLQFRSLLYLPVAVFAATRVVRDRHWPSLAVTSLLAIPAAIAFFRVLPALRDEAIDLTNPLFVDLLAEDPTPAVIVCLLALLAAAAFWINRNWLATAQVLVIPVFLMTSSTARAWYVMFLVPLLALPGAESRPGVRWPQLIALVAFAAGVGYFVFDAVPGQGAWIFLEALAG